MAYGLLLMAFKKINMRERIKHIIETEQQNYINELMEFLKIPSVSTDKSYLKGIRDAADFLLAKLKMAGADKVELFETKGHPVVYAEKCIDENLPTVLIYGHYDVQPPDPLELWNSPPFEPTIRDGKIYARGACDNKGQLYMHVKVLELLTKLNTFHCNLKFLFEGEEETGSVSLSTFIQQHAEMLKADVLLISDTALISNEQPAIITGLKGICYAEIEVSAHPCDLHSGIYGGVVANPANALTKILSRLQDDAGKIMIPGFYEGIFPVTDEEKKAMNTAGFKTEGFDPLHLLQENETYTLAEKTAFLPTLDINGLCSGYTGEGAKTIIPSSAKAKLSMRLVPGQSWRKIARSLKAYIQHIASPHIKVELRILTACDAVLTPVHSKAFRAASTALSQTFGVAPLPVRIGGTIPVVRMFKDILNIPSLLMGFGLDSDNIHSPNEHFGISNFLKGIETVPLFFEHFALMNKREMVFETRTQLNVQ